MACVGTKEVGGIGKLNTFERIVHHKVNYRRTVTSSSTQEL